MTLEELTIQFPLDTDTREYFLKAVSTMNQVMNDIVVKHSGMEMPERTISDLCQIFFYVAIDIDKYLEAQHKFGIDIVNKNLQSQLEIFRNDLTIIAQASVERGVPVENILEYLCLYYDEVHKKLFPNQPIIL